MLVQAYISAIVLLTIGLAIGTVYVAKRLKSEGKNGGPFIVHVVTDSLIAIAGMALMFFDITDAGVVIAGMATVDLVWGVFLMEMRGNPPVWVTDGMAQLKKAAVQPAAPTHKKPRRITIV